MKSVGCSNLIALSIVRKDLMRLMSWCCFLNSGEKGIDLFESNRNSMKCGHFLFWEKLATYKKNSSKI